MIIDHATTLASFSYAQFIPRLRDSFLSQPVVPARTHHELGNSTLLLMPAWNERFLGVKAATVTPANRQRALPTVHATYTLYELATGAPLATLDGKLLTTLRTAAASALASQMLSRPDASRLLMIGKGDLAPELIKAHSSVRPIESVRVYGRREEDVARWLESQEFAPRTNPGQIAPLDVVPSSNLSADVADFADIISCATSSPSPVFPGHCCNAGQHIDLVGSYQKHTREADDDLIRRARVFLDSQMAAVESGEIAIPLKSGALNEAQIIGTLADLLRGTCPGRQGDDDITVFKSVGVASEDLTLAEFLYERVSKHP